MRILERRISHTRQLFDLLNTALEADRVPAEVNDLLMKSALDLSTHTHLEEDPKRLLNNIKRHLTVESSSFSLLDYELLLQVLNNIVSICSFEDVLATFTVKDLEEALTSKIPSLVVAACKVIARSYPRGIFSNSVICDILLKLYFDPDTSISIVNSVEQTISTLSCDELIRRRILINNLSLLMAVKKQLEPISLARLLELLDTEASYLTSGEFNQKLFIVSPKEIFRSLELDIVIFIHIITYYTKLLEKAFYPPLQWLLKYILPILSCFGEIYDRKDKYTEVNFFAKPYLFRLFGKISYLDDETTFVSLDNEYIHISNENENIMDFLSLVNPEYLCNHYQNLVIQFASVIPSHLGIIRNLITSVRCFSLIKDQLNSAAILSMPYLEQMVILQKLCQCNHSVNYLLECLPKVMSNLLYSENGDVTETETSSLRRDILERLLEYDREILNVWYVPIKEELKKIIRGRSSKGARASLATIYV